MPENLNWNAKPLIDEVNRKMEKKLKRAALQVARDARALCPVVTGALRESIKAYPSKFPDGGWVVITGGGDQFYWSFVELGYDGHSPKPYMRKALQKNKGFIASTVNSPG